MPKTSFVPAAGRNSVAWVVASLFVSRLFLFSQWEPGPAPSWACGSWARKSPGAGFSGWSLFSFIPSLIFGWRKFPLSGPEAALHYLGMTLLASVLGVLPLTFHRLVSPRLPGLVSTLPFPLAAVAFKILISPPLHIPASDSTVIPLFLISWFAAALIWMWNREFKVAKIALYSSFFAAAYAIAAFGFLHQFSRVVLPASLPIGAAFAWACLAAAIFLSIWALLNRGKGQALGRTGLRPSPGFKVPFTGNPLHVVIEHGREALAGSSGERFPIRNGIPARSSSRKISPATTANTTTCIR
jgi:hypothetical protein